MDRLRGGETLELVCRDPGAREDGAKLVELLAEATPRVTY